MGGKLQLICSLCTQSGIAMLENGSRSAHIQSTLIIFLSYWRSLRQIVHLSPPNSNFKWFFAISGAFLATIAGISAFVGFGATLSTARKTDPKYFSKGLHGSPELADAGAILALRALGWGTVYAITGTTCLCYGIWKLSGAKDLKDFRIKMGNILPILPKNDPPTSRTEFSGLNDLMTYLSEDYGKTK